MYTPPTLYSGSAWANMTVGLLGGSFNPAHEGHIHVSRLAMKHLALDAVWWMVSPQNPLKPKKGMASLKSRMAQARNVTLQRPRIVVTDIETQLGTRYTADTLKKLCDLFPRTRFVWIMGADNLRQIHRWERWEEIFETMPVCVLARPPHGSLLHACPAWERFRSRRVRGYVDHKNLPSWKILHTALNSQSATAIRAKKAKVKSKKYGTRPQESYLS
ncbi:MAG: nicotinate-nucleotide adenylyltransferase [Alphaproteobacteria bacterium]|nr:nicotinate-nucleotide adenylyltransferase [Alphaproteobacteria bacterium]